ncbi:MAG: hypothetical protein Q7T56_02420 [Nocardioidaceae bacterium]|nr:hypothetical protein [Nocardioidaceae bacterium]
MRALVRLLSAVLLAGLVAAGTLVPAEAAAKPAPLTRAKMRSAPVPSLCGYPAGRLVKGRLPGAGVENGFRARLGSVALGKLVKGSRGDAAVEVVCSSRARLVESFVLLYRAGARGPVYRGKVSFGRWSQYGPEVVTSVSIAKRRVNVAGLHTRAEDPLCCGSLPWRAVLRLKGKRTALVSRTTVGEASVARAFLAAVDREDLAAASRYASRAVASGAIAQTRSGSSMRLTRCGARSELPPGSRGCDSVFTVKPPFESSNSALIMHLQVTSTGGWRVTRAFRAE